VPTLHLNGLHTIFGIVRNGLGNVLALPVRDPQTATEPGAALDTVVIVTDPASVTFTPAAATTEDVQAAFDQLAGLIPPDLLAVDEATSGVFDAQEALDKAPEAARDSLTSVFDTHGLEFRGSSRLVNTGCDLENAFFVSIGYTLDAFPDAAAAAAALADPALEQAALAEGFTNAGPAESLGGVPLYTQAVTACDVEATQARAYRQRGRFIVTLDATIPNDALPEEISLDMVLGEFVAQQIYEPLLTDVLYADIR
jgi:hypothetical protein